MAILIKEITLKNGLTINDAVAVVTVASLKTSDENDKIIGFVDLYASEETRVQRKYPVEPHLYRFEFDTSDRESSPIKQAYEHILAKCSILSKSVNDEGEEVDSFFETRERQLFGDCIEI